VGTKTQGFAGLSLEAILNAAIRFVDEQGLEKLTMRALATSMGVFPTALYWYVDSKSRLIALATSVVMSEVGSDLNEGTWEERLIRIARQTRATLHEHPNFASVVASRIHVDTTGYAPGVESLLSVLDSAGFRDDKIVLAFNAFHGGITGWICMELSAPSPEQASNKDWSKGFAESLSDQSSASYPSLSKHLNRMTNRAFMTRWDSGTTSPMTDSFEFLLSIVISGLQLQLAGSRDTSSP
jgi:TetR/AcrR family transcriptional regulator, tetracycline repressor protein